MNITIKISQIIYDDLLSDDYNQHHFVISGVVNDGFAKPHLSESRH